MKDEETGVFLLVKCMCAHVIKMHYSTKADLCIAPLSLDILLISPDI